MTHNLTEMLYTPRLSFGHSRLNSKFCFQYTDPPICPRPKSHESNGVAISKSSIGARDLGSCSV